MSASIAIVGATGNVGREMLDILEQRNFPLSRLAVLASPNSAGQKISFKDQDLIVQNLWDYDFSDTDIVLASAGGSVSAEFAPKAAEQGAIIIDNSSQFRMDTDVPLIVPEVNPEAIKGYTKKNIIANPNCSTIQMVTALKPLQDKFGIKRIVVSTYQATSGTGKAAMEELQTQLAGGKEVAKFSKQIAYNVIPHIDVFREDGQTKEEWKMVVETQKIMSPSIKVHANCARVPVLNGHAEFVNVELENPAGLEQVAEALSLAAGVDFVSTLGAFETPLEVSGKDNVHVSRLRQDTSCDNGYSFWCVGDNLRKGAALNAVQIAELLVKDHL